ncbi:MAG: hypothetical protein JWP10_1128 [Nocardioidaceae bacterium]|nr:hypothetical protein [Nocardioidaceae bacterium]
MKKLVIAAFGVLLSALVLSGCNNDSQSVSDDPTTEVTTAPTTPASSEPTAGEITAETIVGDWEAPDVEWVMHFKSDGTFVEDFEGVTDFRTGNFKVDGSTVTLEGGDGENDSGKIEGETLIFTLGTLKRQ